jgi:hypothetical protein
MRPDTFNTHLHAAIELQKAAAFWYADARAFYELACDADVSDKRRAALFRVVAERQVIAQNLYENAVAEITDVE